MNKAFNRKGKLSFKTAYPSQYIVAYLVKNHAKPSDEPVFDMHGDEVEVCIDERLKFAKLVAALRFGVPKQAPKSRSLDETEVCGTCGSTTYWVSDRVPQTNSFEGYSDLDFVEVGALIQPT